MRYSRLPALLALVVTGLMQSKPAQAQGEDAAPLPRGVLRVSLAPDWSRWNQRFGRGTPGLPDGSREPLAVDFSAESLGTAQLPFLAQSEALIRSATGLGSYGLNLGRAKLTLNASWRTIPVGIEYGLTRRLRLGAAIPIVRSRVEAFLQGPDTAASATLGNAGLNPALLAPAAWDGFRGEVDAALAALLDQANNGPAALRAQAQATLLAIQPTLCALYTLGAGNPGSQQSLCFDPAGSNLSPVLPLLASEAGDSLALRLGRARTDYDATAAAYASQGITLPALTAPFNLPTVAMDSTALRQLVLAAGGPLRGDSLTTLVRTRLGDIELGAWYQLADRPRWRSQLSLVVRLPTGHMDSPHNFLDIGTGDGQLDIEVGLRNDFVLGEQLQVYFGGRFGLQMADQLERRVGPVNLFMPLAANLAMLERNLGDYIALDLTPRWRLDDALSFGLGYHFFRQGSTRWAYADPADEARIGMPASVLDEETAITSMRIGAGLTFSTLARHAAGRARLPYTVTASFLKTFHGAGGAVPDAESFNLTIRAYIRIR